jgi:membrane protein DedA with SNARE-associated domain
MSTHVPTLLQHYGLLFVFLAVLIEQLGLPIPAIPVLIISGLLARHGVLSLPALATLVIAASLLADLTWYYIGRRYGLRTLQTLCRISLEPDACVGRTQNRFHRFGPGSLVVAKLIPGLSVIAPPLAGATRMALGRFVVLSVTGASVFAAVGLGAGFFFAPQVGAVLARIEQMRGIVAAALGSALIGYIGYQWWERRRLHQQLRPEQPRPAHIGVDDLYRELDSGLLSHGTSGGEDLASSTLSYSGTASSVAARY